MDINRSVNKRGRGALDRQDINPSSFRILTGSIKLTAHFPNRHNIYYFIVQSSEF